MRLVLHLFQPAIDFALPPRCAGCGAVVAGDHQLCLECWSALEFLTGEGCASCGVPSVPDGLICGQCLADPPRHDGVKAAVAYGDIARSIILKFKRGRRIGLARLSADAMSRHLPQGSYIIVPVPLHRWRLWSRGFNQSALLAEQLSAYSGQPVLKHILERTKATPMLGGLGAKARRDALQGAFKVSSSGKEALMGKTVVLIDDVYTSGATTEGCTRALKRSGAARVVILCWARVIDKD